MKNFAPSGVLAKQLDSGAHADIVFVANREWMDYLKEKKHVDVSTITPFAYNTLVFVGKGAHDVLRLNEVTKLDRIAVGSPKSVPAGEYAMEALRNAGIEKQVDTHGQARGTKTIQAALDLNPGLSATSRTL